MWTQGGRGRGGGDTFPPTVFFFPSLTLNQSFLIYQQGFVSRRLMPTPIRGGGEKKRGGKKTALAQQHNRSEKARANPCSDAIITHNQIRADLNRHRTQNHIKGNSMCMALHCSQSRLFPAAALPSLTLSLTSSLHFSLSSPLSVIITVAS